MKRKIVWIAACDHGGGKDKFDGKGVLNLFRKKQAERARCLRQEKNALLGRGGGRERIRKKSWGRKSLGRGPCHEASERCSISLFDGEKSAPSRGLLRGRRRSLYLRGKKGLLAERFENP